MRDKYIYIHNKQTNPKSQTVVNQECRGITLMISQTWPSQNDVNCNSVIYLQNLIL